MTEPGWMEREFAAAQREWDAMPESCRPVVVRTRFKDWADTQKAAETPAQAELRQRLEQDWTARLAVTAEPAGPVCYAWSVTRRWNGPVCRHVSCWDIMEGRARTALAQLTGPRP